MIIVCQIPNLIKEIHTYFFFIKHYVNFAFFFFFFFVCFFLDKRMVANVQI